ncbi:MAG: hypothetical protein JNN08_17195 [Bryobacterales bacterium]|nr:hypothetical protein [Bryobacterales bacterium]
MKKYLACLVCVLVLSALPASAQLLARQLKADIPFGFYAGEKWLPGEYRFAVNNHVVEVRSAEQYEAFLLVLDSAKGDKNSAPSITFTKYSNDRIFLARLYDPAFSTDRDLVKSKREREVVSSRVVSQNKPETVMILARLGR